MAPTIPPLSDAETDDTISNDYAECTEWLELEKRRTAVMQTLFDDWHLNKQFPKQMRLDEAGLRCRCTTIGSKSSTTLARNSFGGTIHIFASSVTFLAQFSIGPRAAF